MKHGFSLPLIRGLILIVLSFRWMNAAPVTGNPHQFYVDSVAGDDANTLRVDVNSHLPQQLSWTNLDGAILEETYYDWRKIDGVLWWFTWRGREMEISLLMCG